MTPSSQGGGKRPSGRPATGRSARVPGGEVSTRRSRRQPPARPQGPPPAMWLALIGVPLLGIVLLVAFKAGPGGSSAGEGGAVDPNERIRLLEQEVGSIQTGYAEFMKLTRGGDPDAKHKGKVIEERIHRWMSEWDAIFDGERDAEGRLPEELQSYQRTRARVNQFRLDLLKSSGF